MQFHLDDMTCGGCAGAVTKAVRAADPSATIDADPPSRLVKIDTSLSEEKIVAALRDAGFPPRGL